MNTFLSVFAALILNNIIGEIYANFRIRRSGRVLLKNLLRDQRYSESEMSIDEGLSKMLANTNRTQKD